MGECNVKTTGAFELNLPPRRKPGVTETPAEDTLDSFDRAVTHFHKWIIDTVDDIDAVLQQTDEEFSQAEASLDNLFKPFRSTATDSLEDYVIDNCEWPKKIDKSHWDGSTEPRHDIYSEVKQQSRLFKQQEMQDAEDNCTYQKPQEQLYVHGPGEDVEVLGASGSDESRERAVTVPRPAKEHLLRARPCRYLRRLSGNGRHSSWFRRLIFSGCMASSKQE
ncbi:uncharacterized protein LOC116945409 [Petromyzon marinus]|uniref:uncharacterized protein LOC116945409 n=1 Tax=Petromyzon marinus TaxID=7757 RepID=UPI003F728797